MKTLYILKVGTTFPETLKQLGDFDRWTVAGLNGSSFDVDVLDVEHGAVLPTPDACAGVVITGSHSMVTDNLSWSVALEQWLPQLLDAGVPILGICYGHQLLGRAAGGRVGLHPQGKEIGTVPVRLTDEGQQDRLFAGLPSSFPAHVTHAQSVLRLPDDAVLLAVNGFEPHHAYRLGDYAWGVQFHPEYDTEIMRSYIDQQTVELKGAGRDVAEILQGVTPTPEAGQVLCRFAEIVSSRW